MVDCCVVGDLLLLITIILILDQALLTVLKLKEFGWMDISSIIICCKSVSDIMI